MDMDVTDISHVGLLEYQTDRYTTFTSVTSQYLLSSAS
jgi:hypothetical protein